MATAGVVPRIMGFGPAPAVRKVLALTGIALQQIDVIDLAAFAAVVRAGSFTRAAAQLGVSQSALSQTVRALERRLDMKLLNRTHAQRLAHRGR